MARFQTCLAIVLGHEGGFVDHKNDRGGATNYGVADAADGKKDGLIDVDRDGVGDVAPRNLTLEQAEAIYLRDYWGPAQCARIPEPLDLLVFDASVNHGPGRAIKLLQQVLGVVDDGIIGSGTLAALREDIRAGSIADVCHAYLNNRRSFYDKIIARDPSQAVFAKGWGNRVDHLEQMVA